MVLVEQLEDPLALSSPKSVDLSKAIVAIGSDNSAQRWDAALAMRSALHAPADEQSKVIQVLGQRLKDPDETVDVRRASLGTLECLRNPEIAALAPEFESIFLQKDCSSVTDPTDKALCMSDRITAGILLLRWGIVADVLDTFESITDSDGVVVIAGAIDSFTAEEDSVLRFDANSRQRIVRLLELCLGSDNNATRRSSLIAYYNLLHPGAEKLDEQKKINVTIKSILEKHRNNEMDEDLAKMTGDLLQLFVNGDPDG